MLELGGPVERVLPVDAVEEVTVRVDGEGVVAGRAALHRSGGADGEVAGAEAKVGRQQLARQHVADAQDIGAEVDHGVAAALAYEWLQRGEIRKTEALDVDDVGAAAAMPGEAGDDVRPVAGVKNEDGAGMPGARRLELVVAEAAVEGVAVAGGADEVATGAAEEPVAIATDADEVAAVAAIEQAEAAEAHDREQRIAAGAAQKNGSVAGVGERIVAVAAELLVVVAVRSERVVADAADKDVARRPRPLREQHVVAGAAVEDDAADAECIIVLPVIIAGAADRQRAAQAATERVVAVAAEQHFVRDAAAGLERVVAGAADQRRLAGAAQGQVIVAGAAVEGIGL